MKSKFVTKFTLIACMTCWLSSSKSSAQVASQENYLSPVVLMLETKWPKNRAVNVVCHGHSVPAGYFKTPVTDSLHAYPNLLRVALAEKYDNAVINIIVTAIGGEASNRGAARFDLDVLALKPDVVLIDYALNDRGMDLAQARKNWVSMIEKAQAAGAKVILLTPTPDQKSKLDDPADPLNLHAEQIRQLAAEYHVGLVDSLALFKMQMAQGKALVDFMSQSNHPNSRGHEIVAQELIEWFQVKE